IFYYFSSDSGMATKAIAIIDDEIDVMNLFKEALEQNGFLVCAFSDSIQAYKILEKEIQEYGLILSDFRMPNLNGYELCTKLTKLVDAVLTRIFSHREREKFFEAIAKNDDWFNNIQKYRK